ncbi:hypothetical protein EC396_04340 [Lutibacter sp. HS1-25]|uniref:hypothetical protein n=1 Tax=Lutibacter sp. HS1-25 TaxID=2485000 RepID=UPI001012A2F7|nr:hypothetical protein [Lutibacter sp. HS1-25]RXP60889.1 hypothetical protein EC396_04340 [Lutibacter sp. HS1-25]
MEHIHITKELQTHFLRLYQMAFSDDNFDVLELKMLYSFAQERGVSEEQLNYILLHPTNDNSIPETIELRVEYLYDLAIMIWADGKETLDERNTLKKYCKRFDFLEENIEELTTYLLKNAKEGVKKEVIINDLKNL